MIDYQRVLIKQGPNLVDKSKELSDFYGSNVAINLEAGSDFIYIGSIFPFNNKYFEIQTINAGPAEIFFEFWDGNSWELADDMLDYTSVSGASMAKSEMIRFTPNINKSWVREYESYKVQGLENTVIYSKYWSRISFSEDLAFTLRFLGHKFSTDTHLYASYPDLNNANLRTQFEAGKTDWNLQHLIASDFVIRDLIKRNVIFTKDQLLAPEAFQYASMHYVAYMIYRAFGDGYREDRDLALSLYNQEMDRQFFLTDNNQNARLDLNEIPKSSRFLSR
jgi:hypothetical protein